jgi:hypothetical protein
VTRGEPPTEPAEDADPIDQRLRRLLLDELGTEVFEELQKLGYLDPDVFDELEARPDPVEPTTRAVEPEVAEVEPADAEAPEPEPVGVDDIDSVDDM